MAVIAMFFGIIVSMYYFDKRRHHMPHIHVKYQEQERSWQFLAVRSWKAN